MGDARPNGRGHSSASAKDSGEIPPVAVVTSALEVKFLEMPASTATVAPAGGSSFNGWPPPGDCGQSSVCCNGLGAFSAVLGSSRSHSRGRTLVDLKRVSCGTESSGDGRFPPSRSNSGAGSWSFGK